MRWPRRQRRVCPDEELRPPETQREPRRVRRRLADVGWELLGEALNPLNWF